MRLSKRPTSVLVALGLAAAAGAVVLGSSPATAASGGGGESGPSEVSGEQHHDRSRPLREIPSKPWNNETFVREHPAISPAGATTPRPDGALQAAPAAAPDTATAGINFDGVGNGFPNFGVNSAPPDTTGAVGDTQYVQWVNTAFAVFNKADGKVVDGFPKYGNTLWTGFGGGCEVNNDGDPIVQYDKLAQRWVLTQFSVSSPATYGYLQCVAVSTTSDATGSYNRYAFRYGASEFNDYPKLGVWPDAYYLSFNIFTNGNAFAGPKVCALDRDKMLAGTAATQQCFQLSTSYAGLLPSDLDGTTPPSPGAPNVFAAFGANRLDLWKFHVDWTTPAKTTFTAPPSLPVAGFSEACAGGTCIPQPGTTQQLDSLADRLMYRLAYRNVAGHESWVVTHSVTAGSSVGIRWYELRNLYTIPAVFQQGTYAPNGDYRWMGSAAMDGAGNIAVGYSVSGPNRHPSIAYATHTAEAAGVLGTETELWPGVGSQTTGLSRWGDYSTMTVDPVDDCTFWYSTEYLKANGTFNWSTRVASFRLSSCTPKPASAPSAPTGLTATAGNASVALHWTAPASSGGSTITGYQLYRDGSLVTTTSKDVRDYSDAPLTNDQPYRYQVAAVNAVGPGPLSDPATATPQASPPPAAPTSLTATPGNGRVTLAWTAPAGQITEYRIYRGTTSNSETYLLATSSVGYTDSTVTNGTTYFYKVTAWNAAGESLASNEASATPAAPAAVPGAPSGLTAGTPSSRGVALSWTAPASTGGSAITGYTLYRSTSSGRESSYATSPCQTASCTYNDTNTRSGRTYYYQVAATNAVGTGPRSSELRATAR